MTINSEQFANFKIDYQCPNIVDTTFLRYYNDSRDVLVDKITKEKEDYFYNELSVDLTIGKREYVMPKRGDLAEDGVTVLDGIKYIKGVSVKLKNTDTEYTKIEPGVLENLPSDLKGYEKTPVPFFVVSDNSIFLYPTPTEDVDSGMLVYAIMQPKKLALTDSETLPDNISKAIFLGVAARWFESQRQFDLSQVMQQKFEREMSRVAISLSGRVQSPKQITPPYYINKYC